MIQSSGIHL